MAFVFKQKRSLEPVKSLSEQQLLQKMDQNSIYRIEKVMQQQLEDPKMQFSKTKIPRHPLKNFIELSKNTRCNEQIRQRFMKSIQFSNCLQRQRRHKLAQSAKFQANDLTKHSKFLQAQKKNQERQRDLSRKSKSYQLGPGSYQIPNSLKDKTMVKYEIHKIKSPLKKAPLHALQKAQQKQQLEQNTQNKKVAENVSPGPGHYNPKEKQRQPCCLKYSTKKTTAIKPQECEFQQQDKAKEEQTCIMVSHKCMPSANFRQNSTNHKIHIKSLLDKIIKKQSQDKSKNKSPEQKLSSQLQQDDQYQMLRQVSPGPNQYETSGTFKQQKNLNNIFISKSPRQISEVSKRNISNRMGDMSLLQQQNKTLEAIKTKNQKNLRNRKNLPPFTFNSQRFAKQYTVINEKIQYGTQNSLLKKVNYYSKDYFGSHINRFKYDLPKFANPSPADYNPNKISDYKVRNVYFKGDKERGQVFKGNNNPGPSDYNLSNSKLESMQLIKRAAFNSSEQLERLIIKTTCQNTARSDNKLANTMLTSQQVLDSSNAEDKFKKNMLQKCRYKNVIPGYANKFKSYKKPEKQNKELPYYNVDRSWETKSFNRNFNQSLFSANNPTQIR